MTTTTSPISTRIGQVFIPVRDVPVAADWYAALLGIQPGDITHHGTICDLPAEGDVRLALDGNRPDFTADGPPRFFWWADDLDEVRRHLESIGAAAITEITDIGSVAFLQFEDPDGNPLMVCSSARH
ncbi:VOC family protein [Microbacterium timonense]|uniref:VOC family protein n=1 Tax=Microbacterium timonense TaxID=2086576 RepID=UPI000D0F4E1A|nr:VOC family protein [Microbacterium timonense]